MGGNCENVLGNVIVLVFIVMFWFGVRCVILCVVMVVCDGLNGLVLIFFILLFFVVVWVVFVFIVNNSRWLDVGWLDWLFSFMWNSVGVEVMVLCVGDELVMARLYSLVMMNDV